MFKRIVRSISLAALAAVVSAPLFAQLPPPPPMPPLPGSLEIRIGRQAPPRVRYERRYARPSRDAATAGRCGAGSGTPDTRGRA